MKMMSFSLGAGWIWKESIRGTDHIRPLSQLPLQLDNGYLRADNGQACTGHAGGLHKIARCADCLVNHRTSKGYVGKMQA